MKATHQGHLVRRLVAIDGPNHGIISCSPNPANYWALPANGGFTPTSAVCEEYGRADSPLLSWLNRGQETPGPTKWLVIRNTTKAALRVNRFSAEEFHLAQPGFSFEEGACS